MVGSKAKRTVSTQPLCFGSAYFIAHLWLGIQFCSKHRAISAPPYATHRCEPQSTQSVWFFLLALVLISEFDWSNHSLGNIVLVSPRKTDVFLMHLTQLHLAGINESKCCPAPATPFANWSLEDPEAWNEIPGHSELSMSDCHD